MTPKQWMALLLIYLGYLFAGALIFYFMEHSLETKRRAVQLEERIKINELLRRNFSPENDTELHETLVVISEYCNKPVTDHEEDEYEHPYLWTFFHAFLFSFTVCSTVGYGNISPSTNTSRMIMLVYSVIGVPMSGILFAYLGEMYGSTYIKIYNRYKEYKLSTDNRYRPRTFSMIAKIAALVIPGFIIFIFIPAFIFTKFESWDYFLAVYYSYVTLSTVGFGDYVPTFQPHQEREFGFYFVCYQIFIIFWVVFGLGYILMTIGFIARGLKSNRIIRLEHQLALNIKETQNKIWSGVSKDVNMLGKIINDSYVLKTNTACIEHDDQNGFQRYLRKSSSCPNLTTDELLILKAQSMRNSNGSIKSSKHPPREILTNVVQALNSYRADDDDNISILHKAVRKGSINGNGIDLFSESEILSNENDKNEDFVRLRHKGRYKNDLYRVALSANYKEHVVSIDDEFTQSSITKFKRKRRISEPYKYKFENESPVYNEISPRNSVSINSQEETNILETITIADLIRAIELVHAKEHTTVPLRRRRRASLSKIIEGVRHNSFN